MWEAETFINKDESQIIPEGNQAMVFSVCARLLSGKNTTSESMFRYAGQFTYTTARSHRHGDLARITIDASLFSPYISVTIRDARFDSAHTLSNTRFDFKAMDSFVDLRSRDSWQSDWVDCFRGTARLVMPRIDSVPSQIDMLIYASWGPAFVVVEFKIRGDFCQFATRCRPGSLGKWVRSFPNHPSPKMPNQPSEVKCVAESVPDDSSAVTVTIEAPSSAPTDTHFTGEPIEVNFARIVITLKKKIVFV